jgi:uncharacterized membrane protein YvbJ
MMKIDKKCLSPRDKELLLGHLVTWGSIVFGLVLAIVLAPFGAAENDQEASTTRAEAAPHVMNSDKG